MNLTLNIQTICHPGRLDIQLWNEYFINLNFVVVVVYLSTAELGREVEELVTVITEQEIEHQSADTDAEITRV